MAPDARPDQPRNTPASAHGVARDLSPSGASEPRIVIVGGGAGGIYLAAKLGHRLGQRGKAEITLVDRRLTHVWKPLLHEVAAGTLTGEHNEVSFLQQARRHHFHFQLGDMDGLDRAQRRLGLARLVDDEGVEVAPRRSLDYDVLVIAIGSVVDDFGTPGVAAFAARLDTEQDAERFHRRLLAACGRAELRSRPVEIVIVGGGATGVELAAEVHEAVAEIARYGAMLSRMPAPTRLTLIEAAPRLLTGLPPEVADRAHRDLVRRGVQVLLGQLVTGVSAHEVVLADGRRVQADLTVWAAGIRGPAVLGRLGLATTRSGQLSVSAELRTDDEAIYAFGDCAFVQGAPVPPTAQAAQQQADYLAHSIERRLTGRTVLPFRFEHRGSLVSLGRSNAAGSLTAPWHHRRLTLYGWTARFAYWALQRKHLTTLHGPVRAVLALFGNWLSSRNEPRVKLH